MVVVVTEDRIHWVGKDIRLMPGVNEVDDSAWEDAKKIELVRDHIRLGTFEERPGAAVTAALVQKTFDRDLLNRWLLTVPRALAPTIRAQLEKITPEGAKARHIVEEDEGAAPEEDAGPPAVARAPASGAAPSSKKGRR